ncbi:MAG: phosphoribosylformylglycinamidine cyclo-ligase [SAR324 cluster bacterium]|nr:phosphoribosylformylglycinamidine cyclo-ligase [SAR324 cluster bacterium]
MGRYQTRGVSSKKEDIHQAIFHVDQGLFPHAFCKVVEDYLGNDPDYCCVMHADGAGTKASLAYLYHKETGDLSVFEGIAQDALVMNLDDLLCVGIVDHILLSSTIGRNAKLISGQIIQTIIEGNEKLVKQLAELGISLITTGGETADVGDLVRTLIVDSTVTARVPRSQIITNEKIKPGDIIIGLASFGQTSYESQYNSGIGSNGLTSARHDLLDSDYAQQFPESYDQDIPQSLVYSGPFHLTDPLDNTPLTIGQALLSPTRTYAPIIKDLLHDHHHDISGIIHCSGGGQTKCMKFGKGIRYIKNNLFPVPPLFKTIQKVSDTTWPEMYEVFNMGHRMEVIGPPRLLKVLESIGKQYQLEVQQIGFCEASPVENQLQIVAESGTYEYES